MYRRIPLLVIDSGPVRIFGRFHFSNNIDRHERAYLLITKMSYSIWPGFEYF